MSFVAREYLEVRAEDAARGSSSDLPPAEDRSFLRRHWPAALASGGLLGAAALLAPAWAGSQGPLASRTDQPFLGLVSGLEGPSGAAPPSNSFIVPLPPDVQDDAGTPVQDAAAPAGGGACATPDQNCWITRCCADSSHKCFMKDKDWAGCAESCEPGIHMTDPDFARTPWNCYFVPQSGDAIPPETTQAPTPEPAAPSAPVATEADGLYPTLFCYQIIRVDSYELNVVKKQRELGASIFACEANAVLSDQGVDLGGGVSAIEMGDLSTGSGKETHFANTDIFTRAFDILKERGDILNYDFTVKVDPDAMFLPAMLKDRIKAARPEGQGGGNIYFLNCHFQDKDWMFGAVEVLSLGALNAYYGGRDSACRSALDYNNMGEDTFLAQCLDHLGVQAVADYNLLADGYCSEAPGDCSTGQVAYHPFKDPASWEACFRSATSQR